MMSVASKTSIPLTQEEVILVQLFLEHLDLFKPLIQSDVFGMKNGSLTVHFDHEGTIRSIERRNVLYKA